MSRPNVTVDLGIAGRPRDERATRAIAAAALRQLAEIGYAKMSMESVASEAGVSRATVYRRFRDKADLVTAAVASRDVARPDAGTAPLDALVAYLDEFDARFAESCLEVIGCLLAAREAPGAMALHRRRVVEPRISLARELLARARDLGQLRPDADVDLVLQMLVGAVLARRVSGEPSSPGWARRAVETACRGVASGLPAVRSAAPTRPGRRASG